MERKDVPAAFQQNAVQAVADALKFRLHQKGSHGWVSSHEALGIITEEFHELVGAVQSNDIEEFEKECLDLAVACVFAVASKRSGSFHW